MIHELKTWPGPFDAVIRGAKRFEYRKNDRGFEQGDLLKLREWDPSARPKPPCDLREHLAYNGYTGRVAFTMVTHVLRGPDFDVPEGYVVMSLGSISWGHE